MIPFSSLSTLFHWLAVTVEGPTRPTPKPRSKALDRLSQLDLVPGANQDASSHIAAGLENNSPEHDSSHSARQGSPPMNESSRNASGERSPEESTSLRDTPVDSHSSDSDSQSLEEGKVVVARLDTNPQNPGRLVVRLVWYNGSS